MNLRPADFLAASAPAGGSVIATKIADLTLADWNNLAGICGAVLGGAYLVWKWRKEARRGTRPPIGRD
jgi:hypothetical protein